MPAWASPRRRAIFGALPEGSRRATSQAAWMRAVSAHGAVEMLRADARANLMRVVWVLARHADWTELVTRPTWAVLMDRTGLSRSTMAAWLAWLHRAGLLGTVTPGTILRYRKGTAAGLIDDGRGTEAAEYVLAVPAPLASPQTSAHDRVPNGAQNDAARMSVETTWTPSSPPQEEKNPHPTRAHARPRETKLREAVASDTDRWWPRTITPATRRDQLSAAERARREDVTLRALTARHLRSLLRPVFAQGGTLADALYFVNHRADGTPWPYAGKPRYLPGWIRHRLTEWLDEHGRLRAGLQLPSRAAAGQAARLRAEQNQARTDRQAAAAQRVDPAGPAALARALLAKASPAAARAITRRQLTAVRPEQTATVPVEVPARAAADSQVRRSRPATAARTGAVAPLLRLVESEDVFRREVINRHTTPHAATAATPGLAHQDERQLAADRAWLASLTGTAAGAADENGNA